MSGGLKVSAPDGVQVGNIQHSKLMQPPLLCDALSCVCRKRPGAACI
jgi:hypothetical protein